MTHVLQGDVLTVLATLPADSVHCVVTSPPYWGLRDYGTGQWEGGSAECDHLQPQGQRQDVGRVNTDGFHGSSLVSELKRKPYERLCGKCGATRTDKQLGLEPTPEAYVAKMVEVFREVKRVLRPDGTLWLNIGDSYNGSGGAGGDYADGGLKDGQPKYPGRHIGTLKPKDLVGIPWRLAFALQADGWWLRSDIIWHKPNPMPESVTDRPTKSHEYVFLLTKAARYYYDAEAVKEAAIHEGRAVKASDSAAKNGQKGEHGRTAFGFTQHDTVVEAGRNLRDVWTIASQPYPEAHFATFPEALVEKPILAGTSEKGCCAECGAPWERQVEHRDFDQSVNEVIDSSTVPGLRPNSSADRVRKLSGSTYQHVRGGTLGWRATCTHNAAVVPCTVLDPFAGTFTVGAVARRLGRNAVGIELNPAYVKLAEKRLEAVPLAFGAT